LKLALSFLKKGTNQKKRNKPEYFLLLLLLLLLSPLRGRHRAMEEMLYRAAESGKAKR